MPSVYSGSKTKIAKTHVFEISKNKVSKKSKKNYMFIYTQNDPESHKNTQNINIYPKTHQKHTNIFQIFQNFENTYFSKTVSSK